MAWKTLSILIMKLIQNKSIEHLIKFLTTLSEPVVQ